MPQLINLFTVNGSWAHPINHDFTYEPRSVSTFGNSLLLLVF